MIPRYTYSATIVRWVDGDTVDLVVDCGFYIRLESRFRLFGIDTPERGQDRYDEARMHAESLAPPGREVVVKTYQAPDKYGRFLALIEVDAVTINDSLVTAGLALPYFGGTR